MALLWQQQRCLEQILHEDDSDPEMWCVLGVCYKELGNIQLSHTYLSRCQIMVQELRKRVSAGTPEGLELAQREDQVQTLLEGVAAALKMAASKDTADDNNSAMDIDS